MIEKLLENWLDSASERSYQSVFVQMLGADGYTVLHSTRHCLLEFGKDILAIAPDGVGCAFQLKGDARGRMTVSTFRREIQPQLVQLMSQAPPYPGFPGGPHRAYLVSNGQFEEEVQTAANEMNAMPFPTKVELWSRGHLLDLCKRHAKLLWPSELTDNRSLLGLYLADPRDQLPVSTLASMLTSVLSLHEEASELSEVEFNRACTSAAWITGISISRFAEVENHWAVASGWALCGAMLLGAAERHGIDELSGSVRSSQDLVQSAMLDALSSLWQEVDSRKYLVEGGGLTDPDIYAWRICLLVALLSCLAIADAERPILDARARVRLHQWLARDDLQLSLWGEAAIPQILIWLVWLRRSGHSPRAMTVLGELVRAVVTKNQRGSRGALAPPYYDYDDVMRMRGGLPDRRRSQLRDDEAWDGSSFLAAPLLLLLAHSCEKTACQEIWPDFSRLAHRAVLLDARWQYCSLRASRAAEQTRIYPSTYQWADLQAEAQSAGSCGKIPTNLLKDKGLLAMWMLIAPQRTCVEGVFAMGGLSNAH